MYYGARYYDPLAGRFISADTIVPNPSNPQQLNRYSYLTNNPVRYIDPSGHCATSSGAVTDGDDSTVCGWTGGGTSWDDLDLIAFLGGTMRNRDMNSEVARADAIAAGSGRSVTALIEGPHRAQDLGDTAWCGARGGLGDVLDFFAPATREQIMLHANRVQAL